jgi:hypothetical protein
MTEISSSVALDGCSFLPPVVYSWFSVPSWVWRIVWNWERERERERERGEKERGEREREREREKLRGGNGGEGKRPFMQLGNKPLFLAQCHLGLQGNTAILSYSNLPGLPALWWGQGGG